MKVSAEGNYSRGLIGGGLVAAGLATPGLTGVAQATGGKSIVLDVDTNGFADFQGAAPGGAFYVSGDIMAAGDVTDIGDFHCWGFIRNGDELAVVNQEFAIDGRGKILIAGVENDGARAVVGGTGDFANARGEGLPDIDLFDSGCLLVRQDLTG